MPEKFTSFCRFFLDRALAYWYSNQVFDPITIRTQNGPIPAILIQTRVLTGEITVLIGDKSFDLPASRIITKPNKS